MFLTRFFKILSFVFAFNCFRILFFHLLELIVLKSSEGLLLIRQYLVVESKGKV